ITYPLVMLAIAQRDAQNAERLRRIERAIGARKGHLDDLRNAVDKHRLDQSRHEYLQDRELGQIREIVTKTRGDVEGVAWTIHRSTRATGSSRVLFVTSNGAGVGHLTGVAAIAHHGRSEIEPEVLSLSEAWQVLDTLDLRTRYYP